MKQLILIFSIIIASGFVLKSCNEEQSLQQYYIEKQESNNFMSIDIPASIISLKEDVAPEEKETYESLKKLNLLAFKVNDDNKTEFEIEKEKVKQILKGKNFNELIRMKHKNANVIVKYLGKEDAIDEVIVYASDNEKGFALARVIGDNMQPDKIIKLINNIESVDEDNPLFSQFESIVKEIN
ncbi:MAG: DUF4252 domain-containing protein [Bacteroidota bacterium]